MFAYQLLSFGQALPQGGESQLLVFNPQNDCVSRPDAKSPPKRSRDHYPPVFVDTDMTFMSIHDISYDMTYIHKMSIQLDMT